MLRAIKTRIYPNEDQLCYIANLLGCCRKVYNTLLDYKVAEYNKDNLIDTKTLGKYLTTLKTELPYLNDVHSKVLQQSMRDLNQSFFNFYRGLKTGTHVGFPKFKSKHDNEQSCRFPSDMFNRVGYTCDKIIGNRITLCKQLQKIHFKCSRKDEIYLNKYQSNIRSVTLTKSKSEKYFLSILIKKDAIKPNKETNKNIIGLDLGIKHFIVDSNGNKYENIKVKRSNKNKLKRLHRQLSKKQKGSNNREKARVKLAKFYEKLTNKKNTYLNQISSKIVNENQIICIEDLNIKGMMKNHNLAESIQELSLGLFRQQLEYKSKQSGKKLMVIDRFYPSSKTCHVCGYVNRNLTLKDRSWKCPECGQIHDRDTNAAVNILNEGLKFI